jgi:hypothetical protein
MPRYAKTTQVSVERSKAEIERTLSKYGIEEFFYGTSPRGSGIAFKHNGRLIRMNVPTPPRDDFRTEQKWKQAQRQRWRILLLALKAMLEAVECGLWNFDDVFLAHTCLPSGETIGQTMQPQIQTWIEGGKLPKLLEGIV